MNVTGSRLEYIKFSVCVTYIFWNDIKIGKYFVSIIPYAAHTYICTRNASCIAIFSVRVEYSNMISIKKVSVRELQYSSSRKCWKKWWPSFEHFTIYIVRYYILYYILSIRYILFQWLPTNEPESANSTSLFSLNYEWSRDIFQFHLSNL